MTNAYCAAHPPGTSPVLVDACLFCRAAIERKAAERRKLQDALNVVRGDVLEELRRERCAS